MVTLLEISCDHAGTRSPAIVADRVRHCIVVANHRTGLRSRPSWQWVPAFVTFASFTFDTAVVRVRCLSPGRHRSARRPDTRAGAPIGMPSPAIMATSQRTRPSCGRWKCASPIIRTRPTPASCWPTSTRCWATQRTHFRTTRRRSSSCPLTNSRRSSCTTERVPGPAWPWRRGRCLRSGRRCAGRARRAGRGPASGGRRR